MKLKGLLTIFAAAALALAPLASADAESDIGEKTIVSAVSASELPDSRELEAIYLEKLFYGEGIAPLADYGREALTGTNLELYNAFRAEIEKIAAGERDYTKIKVTLSEGYDSDDSMNSGFNTVINYLLADLPEYFYWYDKTVGCFGGCDDTGTIFAIYFCVSEDYADMTFGADIFEYNGGYFYCTVDSSKITAAKNAVANAKSIVEKYADKSDYEKVIGYSNEICELVEYNYNAVSGSMPYGDPWQLVYVFDNDETTNVVCEGYSKAMQYLCDLGGVDCYTVSGDINDGTNGGAHMWNVIRLGGKSYLVDVTNCDEDAIGTAGDGNCLILKGAATSSATGCCFEIDPYKITYTYDANTLSIYPAELLTVSTEDYEPSAHTHSPADVWSTDAAGHWHACSDCDEKLDYAEHTSDDGTVTIPATETSDGEKTYMCSVCGYIIKTEAIPAIGHTHSPADVWNSDAAGHWRDCSGCDEKLEYAEHISDDGTITTPATETTDGEKTYKCSVCGYIMKTEAIPAIGHTHSPADVWNSDAAGHWHACSGCNEKLDYTEHISDSGTVTTPATETADGVKIYKCSVCGYIIKTEVLPRLEHTHSPANVWSTDTTGHWHACSGCSEKFDYAEHTSDSGTVTTPATETSDGVRTYKCGVCGYIIKTEAVPRLEHTHSPAEAWSTDTEGHWHTCLSCGEKLYYEAHSFADGACTVCGYIRTTDLRVTIILDPASVTLHAGDTKIITATASRNGLAITDAAFTWRSDKDSVVKVNNLGEVVAVGIGTATVTAEYDGVKASCVITVEPRPVLTLTPTGLQLRKGADSKLKIKVTVGGKTVNAPSVEWSSSNTDVATVDDGTVTALKAGTAVITAEYDGVKAACTVTVRTSGSSAVVRPYRPSSVTDTDTSDTAAADNSSDNSGTPNKAKLNGRAADWSDIAKEIISGGGTYKIELNGEKQIPAEVITAVSKSGKAVEVVVDTSVSLEINGAEVNSTLPVAFEKTEVKTENIRGTNGLGFNYIGAANTGITAAFAKGNAGRFANMYVKSGSGFSFAGNAKVSADGSVTLNIPGSGVYVIMLSEFSDLKGDADNNGALNALDAALILKNTAEGTKTKNLPAADYDGNGVCNALDAAFILKQLIS